MTSKKKPEDDKQKSKHQLNVKLEKGENESKRLTEIGTSPEFLAISTMIAMRDCQYDVNDLLSELEKQSKSVRNGDMSRVESMLVAQSHTLDKLFAHMTTRALNQTNMDHYSGFMKLALKAQNQCRMTLESLSNIKNPPVVYAKQANIAHGPQQVNNGPHATENQNQPNKLLSELPDETLDTSRARETISSDQTVAALG